MCKSLIYCYVLFILLTCRQSISKENADERSLDILRDDKQLAVSAKLPWDEPAARSASSTGPASNKQAVISGIFDDNGERTPDISKQLQPKTTSASKTSAVKTQSTASVPAQHVFQPMFGSAASSNALDSSNWNIEQV